MADENQTERIGEQDFTDLTTRNEASPLYWGIHVNGVLGGMNQLGEMYIGIYAERPAHHESLAVRMFGDGRREIVEGSAKGTPGLVREVEVGLYMQFSVAEQFAEWLTAQVSRYKHLYIEAENETIERLREKAKED